ncbi:hypothetical protein J4G37_05330 [Microvirga sp. 3-52]|nr:hypothetical protein [Microvirga sp. 3-52]
MSRIRVAGTSATSVAHSARVAIAFAVSVIPGATCGSIVSRGAVAAGIPFIPSVPVVPGVPIIPGVAITSGVPIVSRAPVIPSIAVVASAVPSPAAIVAFLGGS